MDFPACARPKPKLVEWRHPFDLVDGIMAVVPGQEVHRSVICEECHWYLGILQYESNGQRMVWWRHASPPVLIA